VQNPPALQTDNFYFFYFCDLKRRGLHGVKPFKVPKIELLVSGIQAQTNLTRCYCSGPYCKLQQCLPDLAGLRPHSRHQDDHAGYRHPADGVHNVPCCFLELSQLAALTQLYEVHETCSFNERRASARCARVEASGAISLHCAINPKISFCH
jgi:hypothetical protein